MEVEGYNLDPTSNKDLTAHINEMNSQSTGDLAKQYSSGMGEARGLLNQPSGTNNSLAYGDRAVSDAIRSRSNQGYYQSERKLSVDVLKNAGQDKLRSLQVASQAAGEEVQLNRQKDLLRWQTEQANKRARGAVLGNILGIAGAIGGGIAGSVLMPGAGTAAGAAMGASAGMGVGSAAGNVIGGS